MHCPSTSSTEPVAVFSLTNRSSPLLTLDAEDGCAAFLAVMIPSIQWPSGLLGEAWGSVLQ
jgi:hypothetical protein